MTSIKATNQPKNVPGHLKWLKDTKVKIMSVDGKNISVYEFRHQKDDVTLTNWAKHLRNHYCADSEIDLLRKGTPHSRSEYLINLKFPDSVNPPGPSIRAGDFGEILIADYLEYLMDYWVPRTHYSDKSIRNESIKGCDIIGFKILKHGQELAADSLAIFEVKTKLSEGKPENRLQEALNDSVKDKTRKAESLNAIKQRLLARNDIELSLIVERFQNQVDHPYKEQFGAAALFSTKGYDSTIISQTDASSHPNRDDLILIIVHGNDMMKLVGDLYKRAADEA